MNFIVKPQVSERECEAASHAWVMSLMTVMIGLPFPILNLLSCLLFFLLLPSKTPFIRFHALQAVTSQSLIIIVNSFGISWAISIYFGKAQFNDIFVAYLITAIIFNITDYVYNIIAALKSKRGELYRFAFFGTLSYLVYYADKQDNNVKTELFRRMTTEFLTIVVSFGILFGVLNELKLAPSSKSLTIPIAQEQKLGKKMVNVILATSDEISNPTIDSAVIQVFNRLKANVSESEYAYNLYIIDNEEVNAMTIPGGNILIFSGLIKFCNSPEELSAVIAHEMGHVENRDVVSRLVRNLGINVIISGLLGDHKVIRDLNQQLINSAFDRKQEADADQFALKLLEKSKIDPKSLGNFFKGLKDKHGFMTDNLEIISSHPPDAKRIDAAMNFKTSKSFSIQEFQGINWTNVQRQVK